MQPTRADLSRPASKIVMDLRQLRYFTVLAAHQHFGRAAAVLHIAQPALSRQVQLLEAELGVKLVERHSRGASLTREGELLLDRATFLLRYADQIRVDIMDLQGTPRGTVALGLPPAFAGFFVLPLTRALRDQYPEVRLRVNESFSPSLSDALERGTLDVALLTGPIAAPAQIHAELLLTEGLCAIGPASDARLAVPSLQIQALSEVPLILAGLQKSGVRLAVERSAANANLVLNDVMEVESADVAAQLVADGAGWTVHVASAVRREIQAGLLRAVPIDGLVLERFLAHARQRPPSSATIALMSTIRALVATMIGTGDWPMAQAHETTAEPTGTRDE
jgi:LysR family transcriptional regulator, nitrogen assimilation regulatory protein